MENKKYDVIIIGAGSAGLSAAIYSTRRQLSTLVLSKDIGGQANLAHLVENYPGVDPISGTELMMKFSRQAQKFGAQIVFEEAVGIEKMDGIFKVKTAANEYEAKALILAFGLTHRKLNVPGENELLGRGVTYCANCDGPLFKNKTVAVIGGGNSALDAAEYLSRIASKVYLIHRRNEFRGEEVLQNKVKSTPNIELVLNSVVTKFTGENKINGVILENAETKEPKELKIDGAFIEIGFELKMDFLKGMVSLSKENHIEVYSNCQTSEKGIFAAGDATNVPFKQIVISAGQGAIAALSAYQYIAQKTGEEIRQDWGK